jgi:hypothetical protein
MYVCIAYLNPFVDAFPMESVAAFQCGNVIKSEGTVANAAIAKSYCCCHRGNYDIGVSIYAKFQLLL